MASPRSHSASSDSGSTSLRWRAWSAVLVLLLALLGQTLHTHDGYGEYGGGKTPHHEIQPASAGEAGCPLCVAMHSATPAPPVATPDGIGVAAAAVPEPVRRGHAEPPGNAYRSRPPPRFV